ncbi:succinate dehydrogenase/fumarate reductase iron-sulfur subunit [Pseudogemmobacter faecipullorum]|uniref:Succinate dehydrogenase iron-sulfur subunit n=1 Tax=Pseudogemmobacter faecipullorum TaxID=2755041 RepID=A0ABS8CM12_9RHOB|nr:2Fe-2S iron-sulfur cluster-binding protein [Pseudogemmobacter faecipullorum]MCB5410431.1 succinate dehydrogenase/fumarate reductase iron-sulfur subunit [Pseudogemmobacter faecipullorum]
MEVSVWRGSGDQGGYETFTVPARDNQTVLDVVSWIQQELDPSLTYRYACRVGMCGSCAMMVNGQPRWTCRTHVKKVLQEDRLSIAPLRNLPVIRDLAADMDPFFEKWVKAGGVHKPGRSRDEPIQQVSPEESGRVEANKAIECINCAVCYAACDTVAASPDYLGPAALQRVWTLYNDVKVADRAAVLATATGPGGCMSCHSQGSCSKFCPNELDPLSAVAGLKRAAARAFFKGKA